ncbi:MAG: trypsin-like peptidase domain-containing protein [candidate division KSB1 bacterium]|nr:trypsin-like peptidase domain-containing protein [candidate division KSB1 bacterium]MDZ7305250.1 trypsin-like peptidase domain-containing protein [candidate division KSB1 bacterium]MDZ7314376.1 trypsin-like peptidase domain-containing protein [candidate division KSB1 bacterium]
MSMLQPRYVITGMLAVGGVMAGLFIATYCELPPDTPAFTSPWPMVNPEPHFTGPASDAPAQDLAADKRKSEAGKFADIALAGQAFSQIAAKVIPVVVSIATTKIITASDEERAWERSERGNFFNNRGFRLDPPRYRQQSSGSGIILTPDGYILTNVHVIARAVKITVTLHDNRSFPGRIVGLDPLTEVAVVKIEARGLAAAVLGDSDQLVVGQWVLAIGNPMNLRSTVTAGIISAEGRDINVIPGDYDVEHFIQTDAAINPGNSGGALVNLAGEVVGVNTAIATESGYAMGLGFAIPINLARKIAADLIRYGKVARGYLGIALQEIGEVQAKALQLATPRGVLVDDVYKNSPAQAGGLLPMDVILAIDGIAVQRINHLQALIASKNPGTIINLRIVRDQREIEKRIKLGELPADQSANPNATNLSGQLARVPFKNLGIEVEYITQAEAAALGYAEKSGALVIRVEKFSPAEEGGLRADDLIVAMDRKPILSKQDFLSQLQRLQSGTVTILTVIRRNGRYHIFIEVP